MLADRLKIGDTIGIVSPSTPIMGDREQALDTGRKLLEEIGINSVKGNYVNKNTLGYSATKEEKAEDINNMFSDKNIKGVFSSKGGENSFTCLGLIDYENIKKNPKIVYGISDATNYLNAIYAKTGLVTFYQSDVKSFSFIDKNSFEFQDFKRRLVDGEIGKIHKNSEWKCLREGTTEGIIVGGNLKSLMNLLNTEYMPDVTNKILFLEAYASSTPLEFSNFYKLFSENLPELQINNIEDLAKDMVYNTSKYVFYEDVKEVIPRLKNKYKMAVVSDAWPSLENVFIDADMKKYKEKNKTMPVVKDLYDLE